MLGDKYLLVEPIGAGGMGQVWLARNLATGAEVAAKVLLSSRLTSAPGIARFRREAHATASLAHRAIVRIFDLVELDPSCGSLVMVMELLRGRTLAQRIEHQGPLSLDETLAIVLPILSALSHAHALGIVHRDLKPDNILLAQDPDGLLMPKILDFGISKMLREGERQITGANEIVGTLSYMSPEQARGLAIDARSDVFSIGILLYECLTGVNPFVGEAPVSIDSMLNALFNSVVQPSPRIPEAIWPVIQRALAVRADERFATAAAVADALKIAAPSASAFDWHPSLAHARETITLRPPQLRSRPRIAAAGIAVALVVLACAAATRSTPRGAAAATERAVAAKHVARTVDALALASPSAADSAPAPAPATLRPRRLDDFNVARKPGF